jgi:dTDP-4-amino-4,6-dideoxygalactose transaminase
LHYHCKHTLDHWPNIIYFMVINYNPWPLGQVPKELQRPEPDTIKAMGYDWSDPRDIITMFEKKVAKYAGSNYAVAVDCCTHGIELSLRYLLYTNEIKKGTTILLPYNTYISIAHTVFNLGFSVTFKNEKWSGIYKLHGTRVYDGAVRWTKGMYAKNAHHNPLQCISFQIKKRIPIGRGGMILCNTKQEYNWLKLASYDGRDLSLPYDHPDHVKMAGFHYYMTPEDAARGIILMDHTPEVNEDTGGNLNYPDIQTMLKI